MLTERPKPLVWRRHGYSAMDGPAAGAHGSPAHRGGDSGSPVFSGTSNVTLLGILWGGSGNQFVYSPIANIEQELGALTTR
jgi:hypothetical protein